MITTIVAPEKTNIPDSALRIFLAGGIQKCEDWQNELIELFKMNNFDDDICLINPRRENFPIDDPNAAEEQITWEFNMLEQCDMFTMCFLNSESDQPICFYELGRNIERMKQRFPLTWRDRIVITCDNKFKRKEDVKIQTMLATGGDVKVCFADSDELVRKHFENIVEFNSEKDEIRFIDEI